jgi:hypothetical protein
VFESVKAGQQQLGGLMLNSGPELRRAMRGGLRRRPSGAMAVALVALFVALSGGAAYAATTLGKNSVRTVNIHGSAVTNPKIANNAVTYNKIKPSSVGTVRIVKSEVQARLKSSCTNGQSISAVSDSGVVTCSSSQPTLSNSASTSPITVGTTSTSLATQALAAGSGYLVQATPSITVTPSTVSTADAQHVIVSCTLAAGTSTTAVQTQSVSVDVPAFNAHPQVDTASIPLTVAAPTSATAATATVTCSDTVTDTANGNAAQNPATVTGAAQIFALQAGVATTTTPTTTTSTTTTTS